MNVDVSAIPEEDRHRIIVLGCGERPVEGAVNHDLDHYWDHVDIAFDLEEMPWPVEEAQFRYLFASDVIEHVSDFIRFMDECWRILEVGGVAIVQTCHPSSENVWRDPTHVRPYHPDAFDYLDPDTVWGKRYGWYTDRKWKRIQRSVGDNYVVVIEKRGNEPEVRASNEPEVRNG